MNNPWNYILSFTLCCSIIMTIAILILYLTKKSKLGIILFSLGTIIQGIFIIYLWIYQGFAPMRTMGDTRLWYSLFLFICGLITYFRYKYRWILIFTAILGTIFNIINIANPTLHIEPLIPILQSAWFIPHVSIYMFAYALLGCGSLIAVLNLKHNDSKRSNAADELIIAGVSFLSIGMLLGALWAKQAWGDFWTWDPKETWAAISWLLYLLYIHIKTNKNNHTIANIVAIIAFISLQMCWYGIKIIPQALPSMHIY